MEFVTLQEAPVQSNTCMDASLAAVHFTFPAVFVVSEALELRSVNLAGRAILTAGDYLSAQEGRLVGATPASQRKLHALKAGASDVGYRTIVEFMLAAIAPHSRWAAVSRRIGGWDNGETHTQIALRPLLRSDPMPADELTDLMGLSPAEADISIKLASGLSPVEIAAAQGVSVGTVRAQLRSVYLKTGVRKQADLVASIWRLAAT